MDVKSAAGTRAHFNVLATTTPKLLVGAGGRHAFVLVNETAVTVRIGYSGSLASLGMGIPASQGFTDNYSRDEYWIKSDSSSGTISGFIVI